MPDHIDVYSTVGSSVSNSLFTGDIDRAETYFKTVHSSANASKKEYMFGALVGLVSSNIADSR